MPCSGGYPPDNHEVISGIQSQLNQMYEQMLFYRREADVRTNMLCRVLSQPFGAPIDVDIAAWWERHKQLDQQRATNDNYHCPE